MKIILISIRKDDNKAYKTALTDYEQRIKRYLPFEQLIIDIPKKVNQLPIEKQKVQEGIALKKQLKKGDYLILLDERGKEYSSQNFAKFIEKKIAMSYGRLIFVVGGPFGFSEDIYNLANEKLALSKMTFSHQMIRLFFIEQLYRAFSIINNEKYHHS